MMPDDLKTRVKVSLEQGNAVWANSVALEAHLAELRKESAQWIENCYRHIKEWYKTQYGNLNPGSIEINPDIADDKIKSLTVFFRVGEDLFKEVIEV